MKKTAYNDLMDLVYDSINKYIVDENWMNEVMTEIDNDLSTNGDLWNYLKNGKLYDISKKVDYSGEDEEEEDD